MNNAKKQKKTIEWERLEISLGKLGTIKVKYGTIKDRNGKDLIEAEEIKKRWQEYTENYTRKVLMTQLNTMVWSLT